MARFQTVKFDGFDVIERKLKQLPNNVAKKGFKTELRNAAKLVALAVRRRAPKRTGTLRRAIFWQALKRSYRHSSAAVIGVRVGKKASAAGRAAPHWHLVEYGARGGKMPAQQFITPTWEAQKTSAVAELRESLLRRVDEEIAKLGRR